MQFTAVCVHASRWNCQCHAMASACWRAALVCAYSGSTCCTNATTAAAHCIQQGDQVSVDLHVQARQHLDLVLLLVFATAYDTLMGIILPPTTSAGLVCEARQVRDDTWRGGQFGGWGIGCTAALCCWLCLIRGVLVPKLPPQQKCDDDDQRKQGCNS